MFLVYKKDKNHQLVKCHLLKIQLVSQVEIYLKFLMTREDSRTLFTDEVILAIFIRLDFIWCGEWCRSIWVISLNRYQQWAITIILYTSINNFKHLLNSNFYLCSPMTEFNLMPAECLGTVVAFPADLALIIASSSWRCIFRSFWL